MRHEVEITARYTFWAAPMPTFAGATVYSKHLKLFKLESNWFQKVWKL